MLRVGLKRGGCRKLSGPPRPPDARGPQERSAVEKGARARKVKWGLGFRRKEVSF